LNKNELLEFGKQTDLDVRKRGEELKKERLDRYGQF
jgi:hypothetical protein